MESDRIYEESLEQLRNIRKSLAFSSITIEMDKLDARSKEAITIALANVTADREKQVVNLLSGVH